MKAQSHDVLQASLSMLPKALRSVGLVSAGLRWSSRPIKRALARCCQRSQLIIVLRFPQPSARMAALIFSPFGHSRNMPHRALDAVGIHLNTSAVEKASRQCPTISIAFLMFLVATIRLSARLL